MLQRIKEVILFLLIPFQKLLQKLSRPEPEMTRHQVDYLMEVIQEGDLLVSYEGGRLTSPFIRGIWDHLAVVNDSLKVVEAVSPKVKVVDLEEWLFKKKGVAVIKFADNSTRLLSALYVNKFIGWPYDYLFKYGNKEAYCSEIGYLSYLENDPEFMSHIRKGREILPQDFYDAAEKKLSKLSISRQVLNL